MAGWIMLHRKLLRSQMYKALNSKQRDVMFSCLLMANHTGNSWQWGTEIFECKPGQFVTSLDSLKMNCSKDVSVQSLRTALLKLEKWGFLANKSTKTGRLITIINWDTYQGKTEEGNNHNNKGPTKSQQRTNKELTANNNVKNAENEKNKHTDDALRVAEYMLSQIETHMPDHKKWNIESWAKDIDLAIRIDKRTPRELCELAKWIHVEDPSRFDRSNVLSGKKLRDRFDQINGKRKNKPMAPSNEPHYEKFPE